MILINTKMPKGCWNCGFCCDNRGYYCSVNHNRLAYSIADIPSERPTDCPLVEIDEDVVERATKIDKAIEEMKEEYDNFKYSDNKTLGASFGIRKAIDILEKNLGE